MTNPDIRTPEALTSYQSGDKLDAWSVEPASILCPPHRSPDPEDNTVAAAAWYIIIALLTIIGLATWLAFRMWPVLA
ncbi:hypothetical protein KO516_18220 [Citreicella sp. C3M06]|uniref:hypothetical protein n=1 Tax=Roseobacteraceae TaxID=2854170 RepID=UPI001C09FB73|nr:MULTISPECIES: hypothetical protein [Roseobacteraceae]MBU2962727.1 hypothetical protein [Citreicella sp. C3M06]MDO6586821.1 hypothetical protein [Salipiger sp. 1_MG-2023]